MIRRLSSLMVALWFALYVGAPQLLHPCPQHAVQGSWSESMPAGHHALAGGRARATSAGTASATTASASTTVAGTAASEPDGHLATSGSHAHDTQHSGDSSRPAGDHDCCCPGPQCGSSAIVVQGDASWISVSIVDAKVAIAAPPLVPSASRVAYTLPYATAPPVTAPA